MAGFTDDERKEIDTIKSELMDGEEVEIVAKQFCGSRAAPCCLRPTR